MNDDERTRKIAEIVGNIVAYTITGCLCGLAIALTIKVILMIM